MRKQRCMTRRKKGFGEKQTPLTHKSGDGQEIPEGVYIWEILTQEVGIRHMMCSRLKCLFISELLPLAYPTVVSGSVLAKPS